MCHENHKFHDMLKIHSVFLSSKFARHSSDTVVFIVPRFIIHVHSKNDTHRSRYIFLLSFGPCRSYLYPAGSFHYCMTIKRITSTRVKPSWAIRVRHPHEFTVNLDTVKPHNKQHVKPCDLLWDMLQVNAHHTMRSVVGYRVGIDHTLAPKAMVDHAMTRAWWRGHSQLLVWKFQSISTIWTESVKWTMYTIFVSDLFPISLALSRWGFLRWVYVAIHAPWRHNGIRMYKAYPHQTCVWTRTLKWTHFTTFH